MFRGTHFTRTVGAALAAAGAVVLVTAGQASAATGSGSVSNGYEIPSEHVTFSQNAICGTFHKNNTNDNNRFDPTIHTLPMSGTFGNANSGSGTATFTITDDWNAGPLGTYLDSDCETAGAIEGALDISFTGWSCAEDEAALYTRSNNTTYSLTGTVVCDDLTTTGTVESTSISVSFTGSQVLCGDTGQPACNNANAGTNLSGSYVWTT